MTLKIGSIDERQSQSTISISINVDNVTKDKTIPMVMEISIISNVDKAPDIKRIISAIKRAIGEPFDIDMYSKAINQAFNEWLEYKKERRESYKTVKSLQLCYDKLFKFSNGNSQIASEIIKEAMSNNYSGFFKLKENGNKLTTKAQERDNLSGLATAILSNG